MSDVRQKARTSAELEPGFATPPPKPGREKRITRRRGRGFSIRFLLTLTIFVAIVFAIVREFKNHLELLVGLSLLFAFSMAIGLAFVAARRKSAMQEAFLALIAASRRAGLPVETGAKAFALQCGSRGYRRRLMRFSNEVSHGMAAPDAAMSIRGLIPKENHASFRAIDATTGSETAFSRLVDVRNATIAAIDPLLNLILYFLVFTIQFVVITSFLLEYVYPKMQAIQADFGMSANATSSGILNFLSDRLILNTFTIRLGLSVFAPLLFIYLMVLSRSGKGLGIFGAFVPFLTTGERAMILRGLAEAFRAEKPLDETLRIFSDWSLRGVPRRRCRLARQAILAGVDWIDALAGERLLLPEEATLARAAVRSGNIATTLETLADTIQSRQWYRLRLAADILNPVCTICMSILVLLLCWTFFVPLVNIIRGLTS